MKALHCCVMFLAKPQIDLFVKSSPIWTPYNPAKNQNNFERLENTQNDKPKVFHIIKTIYGDQGEWNIPELL
jgi:hypothetical protein